MTIFNYRKQWTSRTKSGFAKGKNARAICDRSGFEYPISEMVIEPGTNLLVHYSESDGMYNLVDHPQNYPPRELGDAVAIKNPRVDRSFDDDFVYLSETGDILALSNGQNLSYSEGTN